MKYCGIDLSLEGTGVIVVDNKGKRKKTSLIKTTLAGTGVIVVDNKGKRKKASLIKTTPENVLENRIINIYNEFSKIIKPYTKYRESFKCNIEGLAVGLRGQRMLELAGLHYYFRIKLTKLSCNFIITSPTSLKKYVTGVGNSKKNLMLLSVYKRWGEDFSDDNVADAYGLARMIYDSDFPK